MMHRKRVVLIDLHQSWSMIVNLLSQQRRIDGLLPGLTLPPLRCPLLHQQQRWHSQSKTTKAPTRTAFIALLQNLNRF